MKTTKYKRSLAIILIFIMLVSITACSNDLETDLNSSKADLSNSEVESSVLEQESSSSGIELNGEKKFDVILWNERREHYNAANGTDLIKYAAAQFENKTGIKVNLISIDAKTQDEYFEKRLERLHKDDQPEMILFNTLNDDELFMMDSMKNELLHIGDYIENSNDIFEGMKGDQYCAFATFELAPVLMNKVINQLGYEPSGVVMKSEEVDALFLKWAETKGGAFNLFDYFNLFSLRESNMIQIKDKEVKLDQEAIISKINRIESFVRAYPERNLSSDDINGMYNGENDELYNKEFEVALEESYSKPVEFLTHSTFNAFDMLDFSNRINNVFSGVFISDCNLTNSIGFGILDNQSEEQADAIDFANFLVSPEFQMELRTFTTESPRISGPVLNSIVKKEVESARSHELLQNGEPIQASIIEIQEVLTERYNQKGYLQSVARSKISKVAEEEIFKLSTAQIWGIAKTDDELRAEISSLEERLNLMMNERVQ